jgi:hypothetical protein
MSLRRRCASWSAAASALPVVALVLAIARDASADATWLPGPARALPRTTSASRDAPVFEYAYGPRAQASIGAEPGLLEVRRDATTLRVGIYAMIGLENATATRVFPPAELWRGLVGGSVSLELPRLARAWLGPGDALELSLTLGHESDHATAGESVPSPSPRDIPFGGGGNCVAPDVAARLGVGRAVTVLVRLQDRIYWNELPAMFGARSASDTVADDLHEGLANAPGADLVVRWQAARWIVPSVALFAEHLFPHDGFVDGGGFFRALCGVVFPGRVGELEPFASFDAGNGKGLLVERRELRLSVGVRYALF